MQVFGLSAVKIVTYMSHVFQYLKSVVALYLTRFFCCLAREFVLED